MLNRCFGKKSFSLLELMIVVMILATVLVTLMRVFVFCSRLAEAARNISLATNEAQAMIESIRNHQFTDICADYSAGGIPGNIINLTQINGVATVDIDPDACAGTNLLDIEVVVSWRNIDGRNSGEDVNLNGALDGGEDSDGDGRIDSLVSLRSKFARR